jgi:hypothetical protein
MSRLEGRCSDYSSTLLPCSIPRWDIKADRVLLTLSAADTGVTVIELSGVMDIISRFMAIGCDFRHLSGQRVIKAAMLDSRRFCERFVEQKWGTCSDIRFDNRIAAAI